MGNVLGLGKEDRMLVRLWNGADRSMGDVGFLINPAAVTGHSYSCMPTLFMVLDGECQCYVTGALLKRYKERVECQ